MIRRRPAGPPPGLGTGRHGGRPCPTRPVAPPGMAIRPSGGHDPGRKGGLTSPPMQEFLAAIQSGASGDDIAAIPLPETYRAAFVRRDEVGMFEGLESDDKDPRKSLHVSDVAVPELAPDEAYIAVMASAINFNTVWTSIFEPLPTFGFLDRLGKESRWGKRHALDYHVVGSDACRGGPSDRLGRAELEAGGPGDRPLQLCRRPEPERPRRLDPGRQPADLGVRDQLRRPGRPGRGQGQPADAQARPPHLGGGGRQRPVQLHVLPDAGLEERGPDEAGGQGAGVGGVRRARRLRRPVRAQRRGNPGWRGVVTAEGGAPPRSRVWRR